MALTKNEKKSPRWRSKMRSRQALKGSSAKPRICIFRSSKHTYAQIISDDTGATLCSASSLDKEVLSEVKKLGAEVKKSSKSTPTAALVGKVLAQRAIQKGIESVIFDRNGFLYHGRVSALADGAREGGLKF